MYVYMCVNFFFERRRREEWLAEKRSRRGAENKKRVGSGWAGLFFFSFPSPAYFGRHIGTIHSRSSSSIYLSGDRQAEGTMPTPWPDAIVMR